jgi:hypothetical protein
MDSESSALDYLKNNPNNKKRFWETDIGKVFAHGIHEHNSAIGLIKGAISLYRKGHYTGKGLADAIETYTKKAQDSVDFIYTKTRELQGF